MMEQTRLGIPNVSLRTGSLSPQTLDLWSSISR